MNTFETGHIGEWTKSPELPMDGRVLDIEDYYGFRLKAFYNHMTDKWRSYPEGYLLANRDEVYPLSQWRETGISVLISD